MCVNLHVLYDLLTGRFLKFAIFRFTRNDQAASGDILSRIQGGDLLLRDLGVFSVRVFRQISERRAFFLSRLRQQVWIAHPDGRPFPLLAHLRRHGSFDGPVLPGSQERVLVCLIAVPASQAVAAERRRRLRHNRDRRLRPTPERLALLGWALMITNVPAQTWDAQTACTVYRVRCRIEIIFKAWKRHFSFPALPAASPAYVETILWARLLLVTLSCSLLKDPFRPTARNSPGPLSLLKAAPCILFRLLHASLRPAAISAQRLREILRRLCSYDHRRDRLCFPLFARQSG